MHNFIFAAHRQGQTNADCVMRRLGCTSVGRLLQSFTIQTTKPEDFTTIELCIMAREADFKY